MELVSKVKSMKFITNRFYKRFPKIGLLADLALIGSAATKIAQRRWFAGTNSLGVSQSLSTSEMVLAGGAALRILSRIFRR